MIYHCLIIMEKKYMIENFKSLSEKQIKDYTHNFVDAANINPLPKYHASALWSDLDD